MMTYLGYQDDKLREEELQEKTKQAAEEESKVVGVDVLVGAIHTAEQLQAEVDGRTYQDQLLKIQVSAVRCVLPRLQSVGRL